ncbi:hypothetical protein G6F40_015337 [Rhizopus arrhizus]|nr:hypothetical protein G6F40_015337 [Rhizopus arrhizus]
MPSRNPKSPTRLTRNAFMLAKIAAHRFPAEEQLHHVVRHHQHQHGEREQRDVREEALVAGIIRHVADGVDVHHQRHGGHHDHHHGRQRIDQEADFQLGLADEAPGVDRAVKAQAVQHVGQHHHRTAGGDEHAQDGDDVRGATADRTAQEAGAEKARENCSGQRWQRDEQVEIG